MWFAALPTARSARELERLAEHVSLDEGLSALIEVLPAAGATGALLIWTPAMLFVSCLARRASTEQIVAAVDRLRHDPLGRLYLMSLLGPRLKHDRCFDELLRQLAEDPISAPVAVGLFEALPHDVARRFFAELVREPPPEAAAIVADNVAEADSLFSVREQAAALIQLAEQNTGNTAIVILNNFTGRGHGRRPVEAEAGEL